MVFYGRLAVAVLFGMCMLRLCILATKIYYHEHAIATRAHDDDVFADQLCADPTIKAGLGRYSLCEEARVNVQLSPRWVALWRVGDHLFHCGDTSCLVWLSQGIASLTSSLYGLVLAVALVLLPPTCLYAMSHFAVPPDDAADGGGPLPLYRLRRAQIGRAHV